MDGKEQSSVLQTTIFETFLDLKYFVLGFNQFSILKDTFVRFKDDFWQFKKDPERTKYKMYGSPYKATWEHYWIEIR